jgi:uncharacterized protein (DUF2147 family)
MTKEQSMKRMLAAATFFVLLSSGVVSAESPDAIVGEWYTAGGTSVVEIYQCSELYCGKIVWLKNPKTEEGKDKTDVKNPDESKRSRRIMGLEILSGFKHAGENIWEDGKIYDPKNGKTYSCKMKLDGSELKVRGYVGFALLGRTTVWTRKSCSSNSQS